MGRTTLQWEDVIQFEEVEGYGQHIWRDGNKLYYVTEEGGIAPQRVVYELPNELFTLLESGERTQLEILSKLQNDCWPPTEEEKKASEKRFIEESPTSLIDLPETRDLFTKEELEKLIPIAEQMWIDWRGKLPDDYVSPLK
ncbi:Uncharacterised protein [Granulicatella adiacens]|uniref:hypothetical protein n=1 Tax=Granulicatella adiacens TaxID=46124 RepID=UPI00195601A6|nr:hypothetical protein [Granulicatella adiacens]VTX71514.1 Uncharacterised protein [Granulicatella adiacens]